MRRAVIAGSRVVIGRRQVTIIEFCATAKGVRIIFHFATRFVACRLNAGAGTKLVAWGEAVACVRSVIETAVGNVERQIVVACAT